MSEPIFTATVEITEPTEYVDRTLQTASWWDRYEIHPQTAEVHVYDRDWVVRLNATLCESYRVNRLFTASSAETTYPQTEDVVILTGYSYELDPSSLHWKPLRILGYEVEANPTDVALFALQWTTAPYDEHEKQARIHRLLGWLAADQPDAVIAAVKGLRDRDRKAAEEKRDAARAANAETASTL